MTPARLRAADYMWWTAALAWPLGVFLQTPAAGVSLLTILALALLILEAPDAIAARKARVPFEIWMPAAGIAVLTVVLPALTAHSTARDTFEALLWLLLTVQRNPPRQAIQRYIFASMVSVAVIALLSLGAPWIGLLPTAYSFRSGAALTFAYTLAEGVHVLLLGCVFAVYIFRGRAFSGIQRAIAAACALAIAALLGVRGMEWWRDTGVLPVVSYPVLPWLAWIPALMGLWLVARVVAKIEVERRAAPDPLHTMWWMAAAGTVLIAAFAPLPVRAHQGIVLGLACATALPPPRLGVQAARWPVLGSLMVLAFAVMNTIKVFPANVHDPRQYDAAAQREMPRVFDRMDWIDRHAPHERRTHLWRARAAMDYGLPNLASFALTQALRPLDGPTVLPPPTESERQRFLVQMRDLAASLPEDRAVCAYERVLLAGGERDAALYSLRLRTRVPLIHVEDADAAPYARVAAIILGDPGIAEEFRTWTADDVLTLLSLWGADAAFTSATVEAPGGLFILAAQRTWDTFTVHVRAGERVTEFGEPLAPVTQREIAPLARTSVMVWAGPDTGEANGDARYTLNVLTDEGLRPAAYVDIPAEGDARFAWAEDPPAIAFTPAVRVRIGR